eukprot:SAG11_NODE_23345_length_390_cov_1.230241_1_plen_57_part_01
MCTRTGFYEADGYFTGGPAPWLQTREAALATEHAHVSMLASPERAVGPGGVGGCNAA